MKFLEKTFYAHPFLINPVPSENCSRACIMKQTKVAGGNNSIHGCHVHSHGGMFKFAFLIFINSFYSGWNEVTLGWCNIRKSSSLTFQCNNNDPFKFFRIWSLRTQNFHLFFKTFSTISYTVICASLANVGANRSRKNCWFWTCVVLISAEVVTTAVPCFVISFYTVIDAKEIKKMHKSIGVLGEKCRCWAAIILLFLFLMLDFLH